MIRLVLLSMAVISLSGCMTTFELAAKRLSADFFLY